MLDWSVGRIVEAPSNLKLTERTLLIVVSINAPREGVHGHESAGDLGGPGAPSGKVAIECQSSCVGRAGSIPNPGT